MLFPQQVIQTNVNTPGAGSNKNRGSFGVRRLMGQPSQSHRPEVMTPSFPNRGSAGIMPLNEGFLSV